MGGAKTEIEKGALRLLLGGVGVRLGREALIM
jgi:hypothetical protein